MVMQWTIWLAAEAAQAEGGLFDLDATLPLMALQFLVLLAVLNAIFYRPLSRAIDERNEYIRQNQADARAQLDQAEQLGKQYEQELAQARRRSQEIVAAAQAEAQKLAAQEIADAQRAAQAEREKAQQEIDAQRQEAMQALEAQVDSLSQQLVEKLLGESLAA